MHIRLALIIVVVFLGGCATGYDGPRSRGYYNNSLYNPVMNGSYGYRGYPYPVYGGFGFDNSYFRGDLRPHHGSHRVDSHHGGRHHR